MTASNVHENHERFVRIALENEVFIKHILRIPTIKNSDPMSAEDCIRFIMQPCGTDDNTVLQFINDITKLHETSGARLNMVLLDDIKKAGAHLFPRIPRNDPFRETYRSLFDIPSGKSKFFACCNKISPL